MNSLRGSRPGFLPRFLLPRSQHEGFEIPKKYEDRIFITHCAHLVRPSFTGTQQFAIYESIEHDFSAGDRSSRVSRGASVMRLSPPASQPRSWLPSGAILCHSSFEVLYYSLGIPSSQSVLEPICLHGEVTNVQLKFLCSQARLRNPGLSHKPTASVNPKPHQ